MDLVYRALTVMTNVHCYEKTQLLTHVVVVLMMMMMMKSQMMKVFLIFLECEL